MRLSHPLFSGPQPSGGSFFGLRAPRNPKKPCLISGPTFVTLGHVNARFRLQTPGQSPGGPKAISYQFMITAVLLPKLPRTNPLNCSLGQRLVPWICSFFLIISLSPAVFGQGKSIGCALETGTCFKSHSRRVGQEDGKRGPFHQPAPGHFGSAAAISAILGGEKP